MELLVKKAQRGDKEAFTKLIDGYMTQMYKVAKTRLKNEEDIGDAIQETILAAFTGIKSLRQLNYFNTWIIKILINKCNDITRKNKIIYVEDYEGVKSEGLSFSPNEKIDEKLDFNGVLNILSEEYRTTVVMYYVNRFNTREISEILNEKEGTIKSRLSRAKYKLKAHYLNLSAENLEIGVDCK